MINKKITKGIIAIICILVMIFFLILLAMVQGSIDVTLVDIFNGLFIEYDRRVATIYNLRFPRILVSLMAGGALSVSGLLFQSSLKNSLADPGIIGISGGAMLGSTIISTIFPMMYFFSPLFGCIGGILAYFLIYSLAWKGSLDPVRIILVGIAVSAVFEGVISIFSAVGNRTGVSLTVSGLTQLQWIDVKILAIYSIIGLILAIIISPMCNLLSLEDKSVRGLGVNVDIVRLVVSSVAVLLCAGTTSVIGIIGFLALVAPHIARKIIGNDHKILVPFTMLLGAFLLLLADTIGRTIFSPTEISANIIMNIIGGPFFIFLIRKEVSNGRN